MKTGSISGDGILAAFGSDGNMVYSTLLPKKINALPCQY